MPRIVWDPQRKQLIERWAQDALAIPTLKSNHALQIWIAKNQLHDGLWPPFVGDYEDDLGTSWAMVQVLSARRLRVPHRHALESALEQSLSTQGGFAVPEELSLDWTSTLYAWRSLTWLTHHRPSGGSNITHALKQNSPVGPAEIYLDLEIARVAHVRFPYQATSLLRRWLDSFRYVHNLDQIQTLYFLIQSYQLVGIEIPSRKRASIRRAILELPSSTNPFDNYYEVGVLKDLGGIPLKLSRTLIADIHQRDFQEQRVEVKKAADPILTYTVLETLRQLGSALPPETSVVRELDQWKLPNGGFKLGEEEGGTTPYSVLMATYYALRTERLY